MYDSELDHFEEHEKEWREKEDVEVNIKEEMKKAMKELQCIPDITGHSYKDLFIHPNLDLPEGFKIPNTYTFGGVTPIATSSWELEGIKLY